LRHRGYNGSAGYSDTGVGGTSNRWLSKIAAATSAKRWPLRCECSRSISNALSAAGVFGDGYADSGLVFRQPDGLPAQPVLFTLAFTQMAKKAKLGPIRLHDLRHTQVALLASAGVPAKVVSERLGHHAMVEG
jgi:integrase